MKRRMGVSSEMIAEIRVAAAKVPAVSCPITESSPGVVLERARKNADRAIEIARYLARRYRG